MEPGTWRLGLEGGGEGGARNVGRRKESLSMMSVVSPRKVVRQFPIKQCDGLDTMQGLICICKDALNELFLAGRNKGFLNKESARQQSFLWLFPMKWFAFLTVRGGEQMSCERYGCWCTQDWAGKLGRLFTEGSVTDPSDGDYPLLCILKCTWILPFFPTFVSVYYFNWVAFHLPFM